MNAQTAHRPVKPTDFVKALNKTIKEQSEKLNNQKTQLFHLQSQNARFKDIVKSAGLSITSGAEEGKGERKSSGSYREKHQSENEKSTWKDIWETKGRNQTPRLALSIDTDSVSGTSSVMATPMVDHHTLPSRESVKNDNNGAKTHRGDPRSDWERGVVEKKIGPPSPKRENVIPTGPRLGRRESVRDGPAPPPSPSYLSENGWGDFYSPDGFGTMQADRLDYT